jgi:hypothetical protein
VDQLREAIKKTIEYGQKFGVEYGYKEIEERLISNNVYSKEIVKAKLQELKFEDIKEKNNNLFKDKVKKATTLGQTLAKNFRSISMIGITGSIAAGNPKENEDIDLMIITSNDSLWTTRLEINVWVWTNKVPHRRRGQKQKKDEFCFNLWLEGGSLTLPKDRQNLKNAMDLILMKPVVNKNDTYERFIENNSWVKKYVATGYNKKNLSPSGIYGFTKKGKAHFSIGGVINMLAFWMQYLYMKGKLTDETVDLKRAFFHPRVGK